MLNLLQLKNYKHHCKITINDKKRELIAKINVKKEYINNGILTVKLSKVQKIKRMNQMFYNCDRLKSIVSVSDYTKDNITNISHMFYGCTSFIGFSDIDKINTTNVEDLSCLFYGCSSLQQIPDISSWNVENVKDMQYLLLFICKVFSRYFQMEYKKS